MNKETGLVYNRFRYYDNESGSYISQDPIGLDGNNPTFYGFVRDTNKWVDTFGLDPYDPISILNDKGYTGVVQTPGGGLDYSASKALHPSPNSIQTISYTGDYMKDFEAASQQGFNQKSTPKGYVWHHLDDYDPATGRGSMQLVERDAHLGISHKGGVAQYEKATGNKYTFPLRRSKTSSAETSAKPHSH